jgi:hypothetical protein
MAIDSFIASFNLFHSPQSKITKFHVSLTYGERYKQKSNEIKGTFNQIKQKGISQLN